MTKNPDKSVSSIFVSTEDGRGSDTVESEGRQMKQCWKSTFKVQKFPQKKRRWPAPVVLSSVHSVLIRRHRAELKCGYLEDLKSFYISYDRTRTMIWHDLFNIFIFPMLRAVQAFRNMYLYVCTQEDQDISWDTPFKLEMVSQDQRNQRRMSRCWPWMCLRPRRETTRL